MSKKYKYETTLSRIWFNDNTDAPEVVVPEGDGWVLAGMAATTYHLFWTWRKLVT